MSDPMTNVEIEDVLSSIRRLVSDGDKARSRDKSQDEETRREARPATQAESSAQAKPAESKPVQSSDRLILTPAFLVPEAEQTAQAESALSPKPDQDADDTDSDWSEGEWSEDNWADEDEAADADHPADAQADVKDERQTDADDTEASDPDQEPLTLTDMVFDGQDAEDEDTGVDARHVPDRSDLVATIAELEAAMGPDSNEYEPEGNEPMTETPANTIAWPGSSFRRSGEVAQDAEVSHDGGEQGEAQHDDVEREEVSSSDDRADAAEDEAVEDEAEPILTFNHATQTAMDAPEANADDRVAVDAGDDYDDDLDGLLNAGGPSFDEEALRELVADVVRQELTGAMGERITRNVRKLVRREIYRVLSSQEFD